MENKWMSSFRDIAWSNVRSAVPSIVEGAKRAWSRVEGTVTKSPGSAAETTDHGAVTLDSVQVWIDTLDKRTKELADEAVSSFQVVRSITEQHSQLVEAVDLLLERTRVLLWACGLLGLAVVVLFVLVASR